MTEPTGPSVSLYRTQSIGELLEHAAKEMPELRDDGVVVAVKVDDRGASVAGSVTVKNFTGQVVATRTWTGSKEVSGAVRWTF